MKIKNKIIILASIIVLLIAAIIVLNNFRNRDELKNVAAVQITNVTNAVKSFTVTDDGGKYSVLQEMEMWFSPDNTNAFLNQEYVGQVFSEACNFSVIPVEENTNDLSKYGLDKPKSFFDFSDKIGNKYSLKFGSKVPTGVGYYVTLNDDKNVYIATNDQFNMLCGGLNSLRNKKMITINSDNFYSITIKNQENIITIGPKLAQNVNAHSSTIWEMKQPYIGDVDKYAFESKILNVLDFTVYDFVDDNPSDYGKYGLDNPVYTITVDTNASYTVMLGKTFLDNDEENTKLIYMQIKGLPNVFSIKEEQVAYKDVKPVDLLESLVFSRILNCVDTINYKNEGVFHVLKVSEPNFYIDGKTVDEDDFRDTYTKIISPVILGEVKYETGNEICSFTFNFNTNTPSETLTFYEYGELYAAAKVNGQTDFYVKRSSVDDMIEAINKLAK